MNKALRANILDIDYKGVKIKVNAKNEFISIVLSEDLLKEGKEKIEKILLNALNEASNKSQAAMAQEAKKLTGGMDIPGM
jgi:DNA-binding protein YbaB